MVRTGELGLDVPRRKQQGTEHTLRNVDVVPRIAVERGQAGPHVHAMLHAGRLGQQSPACGQRLRTESKTELSADSSLWTRSFSAMSSRSDMSCLATPLEAPVVGPETTDGVCKSSMWRPMGFERNAADVSLNRRMVCRSLCREPRMLCQSSKAASA